MMRSRSRPRVFLALACEALLELTSQRQKALEGWTVGIEEGDVCVGSRKTKG